MLCRQQKNNNRLYWGYGMKTKTAAKKKPKAVTTEEGQPDPIDIHVGRRMRQRRILVGMSQEKLAESVGLTFQQIQKYERGTNRMGSSRLFRFAQALGVSVSYFYEDMTPAMLHAPRQLAFNENKQDELPEDILQGNLLHQRETLDLVRAYHCITDVRQRRLIMDLIKSMA